MVAENRSQKRNQGDFSKKRAVHHFQENADTGRVSPVYRGKRTVEERWAWKLATDTQGAREQGHINRSKMLRCHYKRRQERGKGHRWWLLQVQGWPEQMAPVGAVSF